MNNFKKVIKSSVKAIKPYQLQEFAYQVKLNQNESPYDIPGWLKKEIFEEFAALPWNRYPSFGNHVLVQKLAQKLDTEPGRLLVGNGSNELLQTLISVVLSKGKNMLLVAPTFLIYQQLSRVAEAEIIAVEFEEDWSFPVQEILRTLQEEDIALCILSTPNSPTGALLAEEDLERILSVAKGLVLIDEAYFEFSHADYTKLQRTFKNLIIIRTFSKAMGLAGLRIGYLIARPELIREINKAKLPYNLNVFSEFVACKLLDNYDLVQENVEKINFEKSRLNQNLGELQNVKVFPSGANFVMIETPLPSAQIFERLLKYGVLVRDISGYHARLRNKLRITVGTAAENDAFIAALKFSLRDVT